MQIQELENLVLLLLSEEAGKASEKAGKELLELRYPQFAAHMFELIQKPVYQASKAELLRICWENGADFSEYSLPLIDMVKYAPWPEAIEASSVIESMRPDTFSHLKKEEDLNHILQSFEKLDPQRKAFTGRLIELYEISDENLV